MQGTEFILHAKYRVIILSDKCRFSTSFRLVYRGNLGRSRDVQTRGGREQRNNKKYLAHKAMTLYIIAFMSRLHIVSNVPILIE